MRRVVVGPDEHGDVRRARPRVELHLEPGPRGGQSLGIGRQRRADLVAVGREMIEQDLASIRRAPAEEIALLAWLAAEPAPERPVGDAELGTEGGPDRGVTERVR